MKKKSYKNKTHTLIVSDFHLGTKVSQSRDVYNLIKSFKFRKLILLGDVFESLNFNRLSDNDWKLIALIGSFSKEKKVRWIEGNHDVGLTKVFGAFIGAKVYKSYKWQHNNKKYLAIHGHQFDNFLVNNVLISSMATQIYNLIQLVDFKDRKISRFIKRKSKGWLRVSKKVARRAVRYAMFRQVDYIFCGHTHKADKMRRGSITYYNCGCWTDFPLTYIALDKDEVKIMKYDPKSKSSFEI